MIETRFTPPSLVRPAEFIITPWSYQSIGVPLTVCGQATGGSSQNWPAANTGIFVPFVIPEPMTFTKMFWNNGGAVAGNIDVGLFNEDGSLIVAIGSTVPVNVTTIQTVNITDTTLDRGRYYMGMTSDTSGITQKVIIANPSAGIPQGMGLVADSACAPPFSSSANPATFVAYTLACIPYFGAQGYRTLGP